MELRHRAVSAVFWSVLTTWGEQIITLFLLMLLARMLGPQEFGVVALAGLAIYLMNDLLRSIVNQTMSQMKDADDSHFSSFFWLVMGAAFLASGALILLADGIAAYFGQPALAKIVPWLTVVLVLNSANVIIESRMMRLLTFKPMAIRSLVASMCGGIVAITMAFQGYGYWSIVAQQVVAAGVATIVMWIYTPWMPRVTFSLRHCREVIASAKYFLGISLMSTIVNRIDVFIIGTFLTPAAVGLYNAGLRILRMVLNGMVGAVVRALLPALSRLQGEPERFRTAYLQSFQLSTIISMPLFAGLACTADQAVAVLLGSQWMAAADVLRLLAIAGIMQAIGHLQWTGLTALGRLPFILTVTIISPVVYVISMTIGIQWGIVGVATAFVVTIAIIDSIMLVAMARALDLRSRTYLRYIVPIIMSTGVMICALEVVIYSVDASPFILLPVLTAIGIATYLGAMFVLAPDITKGARRTISEILARRREAKSAAA